MFATPTNPKTTRDLQARNPISYPSEAIYLPSYTSSDDCWPDQSPLKDKLTAYFQHKANDIQRWTRNPPFCGDPPPSDCETLVSILLHRNFNYLSKLRNTRHLPALHAWASHHLRHNQPLNIFLLYHGGYRACPLSQNQSITFTPDQTEFMLLWQIAYLNWKIQCAYPPGIQFTIVINNGVAAWTNGTSIQDSERYSERLRQMINRLDAGNRIHVRVQSELPGFALHKSWGKITPLDSVTEKDHAIIERFLNRECSPEEARYRAALYLAAEATWAEELEPFAQTEHALVMRQVEHPATPSFRPFPGGAIRVQNGTLGFRFNRETFIPTLITSKNISTLNVRKVPYRVPFIEKERTSESLHTT